MPPLDLDTYFAKKLGNLTLDNKLADLATKHEEKVTKLTAYKESSVIVAAQQRADAEAQKASWAGQLGLESESFLSNRVNDAASVVSGTSRLAGHIASLPSSLGSMAATAGLTQEDYDAYNRVTTNKALPGDQERLNGNGDPYTISPMEMLKRAAEHRTTGRSINETMDLNSIVDQTNRNKFTKDIGEGFESNWSQVKEGGVSNIASGVAGLLANAGEAVLSNPAGVREYILENAPQLFVGAAGKAGKAALLASNAGYAADTYQKGIQEYQAKNNGALPDEATRQSMALYATSMMAAEQFGDVAQLGAISKIADTTRAGFKASLKNIGTAGLKGAAAEAPTEGYQTFAEGEVLGKPATAEEIYTGGVIGAASAGTLSTVGRTVTETAGGLQNLAIARKEKAEEEAKQAELVKTADVSSFVNRDTENTEYAPDKAADILLANAKLPDTTLEAKEANLTKAKDILAETKEYQKELLESSTKAEELQKRIDQNTENFKEFADTPVGTDPLIDDYQDKLVKGSAKWQEEIDSLNLKSARATALTAQIQTMESAIANFDKLVIDDKDTADVNTNIAQANTVLDDTATPEDKASVTKSAGIVINLAMASSKKLSSEDATALASNMENQFTPEQRTYLNSYSEAKTAEASAKGMKEVNKEILEGSPDGKRLGIQQYREQLGGAMKANDKKATAKLLTALKAFSSTHADKASLASKLWNDGKGRGGKILFDQNTQAWVDASGSSFEFVKANKGFFTNSAKLIDAIGAESLALKALVNEMTQAENIKFGAGIKKGVQSPSSSAKATPSASTTNPLPDVEGTPRSEPKVSSPTAAKVTPEATSQTSVDITKTNNGIAKGRALLAKLSTKADSAQAETIRDWADDKVRAFTTELKKYTEVSEQRTTMLSTLKELKDLSSNATATYKSLRAKDDVAAITVKPTTKEVVVNSTPDGSQTTPAAPATPSAQVAASDPVELEDNSPGLSVLKGAAKELERIKGQTMAVVYKGMNTAAVWLTQSKAIAINDEDIGRDRPLVVMKNLLTRWNEDKNLHTSFFSPKDLDENGKLTPEENHALNTVRLAATAWEPIIRANFKKGRYSHTRKVWEDTPDRTYTDPVQKFINEDGSIDEEIVLAIAYGGMAWLNDTLNKSLQRTSSELLAMHGLDKEDIALMNETKYIPTGNARNDTFNDYDLSKVSSFSDTARQDIGRYIVDALGLKAKNKDVPADYIPKLITAFGSMGFRMLELAPINNKPDAPTGLIKETKVSFTNIQRALPNFAADMWQDDYLLDTNADTNTTSLSLPKKTGVTKADGTYLTYVQPVSNADFSLPATSERIRTATHGSHDVLGRFFGSEQPSETASWEPVAFNQTKAQGINSNVPAKLAETLNKAQAVPNRIIPAMWNARKVMTDQLVLLMAGAVDTEVGKIQEMNRVSGDAQNRNLKNQLSVMDTSVQHAIDKSPLGIAQPFYAAFSVARNFRVFIKTQDMNVQTSKIHRFMFFRPEWEFTIKLPTAEGANLPLKDQKTHNHFKMGLIQALGFKVDAKAFVKTSKEFDAWVESNEIAKLAMKLHADIQPGAEQSLNSAEKQKLAEFARDAEGMQTFQGLVVLGNYLTAIDKKDVSFTAQMPVGVDGKANGPVLSQLALGAASSVIDMFKRINKGGMFSKEDGKKGFQNFNIWYEQVESLDFYESFASKLLSTIPAFLMNDLNTITGQLITAKGKVTSSGRKIVKLPLTAFNYGSSIPKAIEGMTNGFIQSIADRIYDVSTKGKDAPTREDLIASLNALMKKGNRDGKLNIVSFPANTSIDELMQLDLYKKENTSRRFALENAFYDVMAKPIDAAIKQDYAVFLQRRKAITTMIGTAYSIYATVYNEMKRVEIQRMIESGEMDTTGKTDKQPVFDLTPNQEAALLKRVEAMLPRTNSAYTVDDKNLDAGLYMAKRESQLNAAVMYAVRTNFGKLYGDGKQGTISGVNVQAVQYAETTPGAAAMAYMIQSLDSATIHETMAEMPEILNVHDEAANGADKVVETAQRMNQAIWNNLVKFSPNKEAFEMLERAVVNLGGLIERGGVSPEAAVEIAHQLMGSIPEFRKNPDTGKLYSITSIALGALREAKQNQYTADVVRLESLLEMYSMDQYTWQGGEYLITDEDHAAVEAELYLLKTHNAELSAETVKAAKKLGVIFDKIKTAEANEKEVQKVRDALAAADAAATELAPTTPADMGVTATTLLRVIEAATAMIGKIGNAQELDAFINALRINTPFAEAMKLITNSAVQAALEAAITSTAETIKHLVSPWGELGDSLFDHDMDLVAALEAKPVMTFDDVYPLIVNNLRTKSGPANMREFQYELLNRIKAQAPKGLVIKYVTPETAPANVIEKATTAARGWYVETSNGNQEIYILSTHHMHSAVDSEVLLHELTHAILAGLVESKTKTPEVETLIDDLERIRALAVKFIEKNELNQHLPAVENVQEFIAYGMTNLPFQAEVLGKISLAANTKNNSLVKAMDYFVQKLTALLFRKSNKNQQEQAENGMTLLINNVSGLFYASSQLPSAVDIVLNQAGPTDPRVAINQLTSLGLYEAISSIGNNATQIGDVFNNHLKRMLSSIANKLDGDGGMLKKQLMQDQALSPLDIWTKVQVTGIVPFAAQTLGSGMVQSEQEVFVMAQIEATVRTALADPASSTYSARTELLKLYMTAKEELKSAVANGTLTQAQYDFAFDSQKTKSDSSGNLDYLSRFAAMGLGNEVFYTLLTGVKRARVDTFDEGKSIGDKLRNVFLQILDWFNGLSTKTYGGQNGSSALESLVTSIISIEASKRQGLLKNKERAALTEPAERVIKTITEKARAGVSNLLDSGLVKNSSSAYVRAAGQIGKIYANDRVGEVMNTVFALRDKHIPGVQGIVTDTLKYIQGPKEWAQELLRAGKRNEGERKDAITTIANMLLAGFADAGALLTKKEKSAVTGIFLRTGMYTLLDNFSMTAISDLLTPKSNSRNAAIALLEKQLNVYGSTKAYFIEQTKGLAHFRITGESKIAGGLLLNPANIARQYGSVRATRLPESQAKAAEAIIAQLIPLYALVYANDAIPNQLADAKKVLDSELTRGVDNGVELVLKTHKQMDAESRKVLFEDSEALMMHGSVPEIYNPYTAIEVAEVYSVKAKDLTERGYTRVEALPQDPLDVGRPLHYLYVLKDGGPQPWVSGSMSTSDIGTAKGSVIHNGYTNSYTEQGQANTLLQAAVTANHAVAQRKMYNAKPADWKPSSEKSNYMVPVLNKHGTIVNWRYLMKEATKDTLLERDSDFANVLGAMAGSIYDKQAAAKQNTTVVQALFDQYQLEKEDQKESYIWVGVDSEEPKLREIWDLIPDKAKQDVSKIWGKNKGMWVRKDLLDITFGYRKYSIGESFDKDYRNYAEATLVIVVEHILYLSGMTRGMNSQQATSYSKIAGVKVRKAERIWQELVKLTKDIIVVRSGMVLLGNQLSNGAMLLLKGVSLKDAIRDTQVSMKAGSAWQADSAALAILEAKLAAGYTQGNDAEMKVEIGRLENELKNNPVRALIEAGLMPTIVEDNAADDDLFSYKNAFVRSTEKYTSKLNPVVRTIGKNILMTKDTVPHKFLSRMTQMSDFTARYALYQHLTTRKKNPLSHADAIQEASDTFVNYDIPMPKGLQFADDMGIMFFTKYLLSVQRVIMKTMRDNPARALMLITVNGYLDLIPTIMDSSMVVRFGNNPLSMGAFQIFSVMDNLLTVSSGLTLMKGMTGTATATIPD